MKVPREREGDDHLHLQTTGEGSESNRIESKCWFPFKCLKLVVVFSFCLWLHALQCLLKNSTTASLTSSGIDALRKW